MQQEYSQGDSETQEMQLIEMLGSLRLAEETKQNRACSTQDEQQIPDAEKGTLSGAHLALNAIKTSRFDDRDSAKLQFLNLFHTFKNFIINVKKTQDNDLSEYLELMLEIARYIQEP